MFAWDFGVIRILYWTGETVAVSVFVLSVMDVVAFTGFVEDPYTVTPSSEVISITETPAAAAAEPKLTMSEETALEPKDVRKVKASDDVEEDPGPMVVSAGSVPVPSMVIVAAGVTGELTGTTPVE